jgi:N-acetylglucosaminyldiphosphoundecaprenol N-acetyl-beta-D-mannosaminyltransferase
MDRDRERQGLSATPRPARVDLRGLEIDALTEQQALDLMFSAMHGSEGGVVLTPNIDHLRRHTSRPDVRAAYATAELVLADGMPLVWASRLQGTPLPERVAGSDLIWSVSATAAREDRSVFLLGGAPGVAPLATQRLKTKYRQLRVAGEHCPPFGFLTNEAQLHEMKLAVSASTPDIVFVGLPSPIAERAIEQLRPLLPHAWFLGLGVSLSFVSGDVPRAPNWTHRIGLEWLWRLLHEPRRLFARYILEGLPFVFGTLFRSLLVRLRSNAHKPAATL